MQKKTVGVCPSSFTNNVYYASRRFSPEHVATIAFNMVAPNLVWKAGQKAAAVRTVAIATLWALLRSGLVSRKTSLEMFPRLLTQLTSSLEDDARTTRLTAVKVLTRYGLIRVRYVYHV